MPLTLTGSEAQRLTRLVAGLRAYAADPRDRRKLLETAFSGTARRDDLLNQIDVSGEPYIAAAATVQGLLRFGEIEPGRQALSVFVGYVQEFVAQPEEVAFLAELQSRRGAPSPLPSRPLDAWRDSEDLARVGEIIVGENTLQSIHLLQVALGAARAVVLVRIDDGKNSWSGTGFMIADDLLMTNHHVLHDPGEAARASFVFDYQLGLDGRLLTLTPTARALQGGLFHTHPELDVTVVQLCGLPDFGGPLRLARGVPELNRRVVIIQHPGGQHKQIAMQNNLVRYADRRRVQYTTSTLFGSSGSPVFTPTFEVVAVHHSGGVLKAPGLAPFLGNEGTSLVAVLEELQARAPAIYRRLRVGS